MQAIMISDHAKWCALMMNGKKKIEVRTSKALAKAAQKLIDKYGFAEFYVYCTKDAKGQLHYSKEYGAFYDIYKGPEHYSENGNLNGKVLFKFRCYKVEEILPFEEYESPFGLTYKLTAEKVMNCIKAHLTYNEYNKYLKGKKGYAIHISDLVIFDKPKEVCEFRFYRPTTIKNFYESGHLTKAPQSFCYVEVEK